MYKFFRIDQTQSRRLVLRQIIALGLGCLCLGAVFAKEGVTISEQQDLLTRASRFLYVTQPTRYKAKVQSWSKGQAIDTAQIEVYLGDFSKDQNTGLAKTLVKFTEDGIRKGRLLLYENNRAWMYFRGTQQAMRVPMAEQMVGDADIASILNVDLRQSYQVGGYEEHTENGQTTAILTLSPRNEDAPFGSVTLKIDRNTSRPIESDFYTLSGKLAKSVNYLDFQPYGNDWALHKVRIKSYLNQKSDYTDIEYTSVGAYALPSRFFNPALLKDF